MTDEITLRLAARKQQRRAQIKPAMRVTPEHDPAIPPAAFIETAIMGAWNGNKLLCLGAAPDQFAYNKILNYNCITTDVLDCSKSRCLALRQSHRWLHDIIHGWFEFIDGYMLPHYDTILWVNGPCIQTKEGAIKTIEACKKMKPQRFIIVNELAPPDATEDTPLADLRHSLWTVDDFISLGFTARMWPSGRGSVIAWKDCR